MTGLNIIERWERDLHATDPKRAVVANRLRGLYEFLASQLFHQYEPTKKISRRVNREFLVRLNQWLSCYDKDEDRWAAFRSLEYIFFAGTSEFEELYRCAYDHVIVPWLIEQANLDIFSATISKELSAELNASWPCPVTDSLRINSFLHVTQLNGQSLRPDWISLREFGSKEKISRYVSKKKIRYLILIEDFVGSGGQLCQALKFAAEAYDGPILVLPLIVCAPGDRRIREEIVELGRDNISYAPVVVLEDSCLVGPSANIGEPSLFADLRKAILAGFTLMGGDVNEDAFGWNDVGSLVVMFGNCPNNTPPVYHHNGSSWAPLFPRMVRELKVRL